MGYFDRIAQTQIRENPNGEGWVYFPLGLFGPAKARIVINERRKRVLLAYRKYSFVVLAILGILYGIYFSNHGFEFEQIVELIIFVLLIVMVEYALIRKLTKTDIALTQHERMLILTRGKSEISQYIQICLFSIIIMIGIFSPLISEKPSSEVYEFVLLATLLGVSGVGLCLYNLKYIKSNKSLNDDAPSRRAR